jgi:hypothetical protein
LFKEVMSEEQVTLIKELFSGAMPDKFLAAGAEA